eukprot:1303657-Pleurochrysis_carterae.AAC.1
MHRMRGREGGGRRAIARESHTTTTVVRSVQFEAVPPPAIARSDLAFRAARSGPRTPSSGVHSMPTSLQFPQMCTRFTSESRAL